jgi:protoheme IX farnesyltransferase
MRRTSTQDEADAGRPLPAGRMDRQSALQFGVGVAALSVILMGLAVNYVAAGILLTVSILFYVLVYTVWLKRGRRRIS